MYVYNNIQLVEGKNTESIKVYAKKMNETNKGEINVYNECNRSRTNFLLHKNEKDKRKETLANKIEIKPKYRS